MVLAIILPMMPAMSLAAISIWRCGATRRISWHRLKRHCDAWMKEHMAYARAVATLLTRNGSRLCRTRPTALSASRLLSTNAECFSLVFRTQYRNRIACATNASHSTHRTSEIVVSEKFRQRWQRPALVGLTVIILDQLTKAWILRTLGPNEGASRP